MSRRMEAYRVKRNDNLASPDYWNRRLEDIDLRLAAREGDMETIEAAFEDIQNLALVRMNDVFTPLIQEAKASLNSFGVSFSAETASTVTVGMGAKEVTLSEATRGPFYYAEYVSLRANDDVNVILLAQVTEYIRATGVLTLNVVSAVGSGSHDGWRIAIGSPPDTTHASRTDNPHAVTATQIGSYTTQQTDDAITNAISAAIGALPEVVDALRPTNNLSDLSNKQTARDNLGTLTKASNLLDVPNKALARDYLGTPTLSDNLYDLPNKATARTNLGVPALAANLSDIPDKAAARSNLGVQAALGYTPVQQGTGVGQAPNIVKIGYSGSGYNLKVTVDNTDLGTFWTSANFDPSTKQNVLGFTPGNLNGVNSWTQTQSFVGATSTVANVGAGANVLNTPDGLFWQFRSADTGPAAFSFHRVGAYAINIGLDSDNHIRIGGWSAGTTNRFDYNPGNGNLYLGGALNVGDPAGTRGYLGLSVLATTGVATAANYRANDHYLALTTDIVWEAAGPVQLTDAANITVNMGLGFNFYLTIGGARTLDNPLYPKVGQSGFIRIQQDGGGSKTLDYGTYWRFVGGTHPVLSTAPNAVDVLFYSVISSTEIYASLNKAIS